ncbi:RUS family member 1-like [Ptychodera flava]|uniref:RUS family member 1-like n=1 Tax=Ptychodera flava TaxID=63121 RepID=UPI00396A68D9
MENIICEEQYGSQNSRVQYRSESDGQIRKEASKDRRFSSVSQFFRSVFLPQGYPDSVSEDYLTYQFWDTVQAFCSYLTGTLATQAMLKGVGVGDESATPMAATITWILKDGTGMIGRILFAWMQGTSLDHDCKRWRLFADILNDFALCVELSSPLFPSEYFRYIACFSGLCKSLVGVAGGATRAALTMHQARRNNMADVSAKDGSQETMVNLLGLLVGLIITPMVAGNPQLMWSLFVMFTMLHLFSNYRAVTCVVMETVNQARLHILVQDYLQDPGGSAASLQEVNKAEPVILKQHKLFNINLGTQFNKVIHSIHDLQQHLRNRKDCRYLLGVDKKNTINIVLHQDCSAIEILKSCFQAEIIEFIFRLAKSDKAVPTFRLRDTDTLVNQLVILVKTKQVLSEGDSMEMALGSQSVAEKLFPGFVKELEQSGWVTEYNLLGPDEWRATWNLQGITDKKLY